VPHLQAYGGDPTHPQGLRQATLVVTKQYNRSPEGQARAKLYNSTRWRAFSKSYLAQHPVCELCGGKAAITDHAQGHAGDWLARFWVGPYRPTCRPCNSREGHKKYQRSDSYQAINERRALLRAGVLPGGYLDRSRGDGAQQRPEGPYDTGNSMENVQKNGTATKSSSSRDKLINKLRGTKNG